MMERDVVIVGINLMDQLRRKLCFRKKDGTKIEILATKIYRNIYLFLFALAGLLALVALIYTFVQEVKSFNNLTRFGKVILLFFTLLNLLGLVTYCGFILNVAFHPAKINEVDLGGGVTVAENRIKYVAIGRSSDRTLLARFVAPDDPDSWCIETVVKRDLKTSDTTPGYRRVRKCAKYALFQENDYASMYFVGTGPQYPNKLAWLFIDKIQFKIGDSYYEKGIENYLSYPTGGLSKPLNKGIEDLAKEFSTEKEWGDLNEQQHRIFWEHDLLSEKHAILQKGVSLRTNQSYLSKLIINNYQMETLILKKKEEKHLQKIIKQKQLHKEEKKIKKEFARRKIQEEKERVKREMELLEMKRKIEREVNEIHKAKYEEEEKTEEGEEEEEDIRDGITLNKIMPTSLKQPKDQDDQKTNKKITTATQSGSGMGIRLGKRGKHKKIHRRNISYSKTRVADQIYPENLNQQGILPELTNLLTSGLGDTIVESKDKKKNSIFLENKENELDDFNDRAKDSGVELNQTKLLQSNIFGGGYDPKIEVSTRNHQEDFSKLRSLNLMNEELIKDSSGLDEMAVGGFGLPSLSLPSIDFPSITMPSMKINGLFQQKEVFDDFNHSDDLEIECEIDETKLDTINGIQNINYNNNNNNNNNNYYNNNNNNNVEQTYRGIGRKVELKQEIKFQNSKFSTKTKMKVKKKKRGNKKKQIKNFEIGQCGGGDDENGDFFSDGEEKKTKQQFEEKQKINGNEIAITSEEHQKNIDLEKQKHFEEKRKLEEKMKKLEAQLLNEESSELSFEASEDDCVLLFNKNQNLSKEINKLSTIENDTSDDNLFQTNIELIGKNYIFPRRMNANQLKERDQNLDQNFGSELNPKIILESYNENRKFFFFTNQIKEEGEERKKMEYFEIENRTKLIENFPIKKYLKDEFKKKREGQLEMDNKEQYQNVRKELLDDLIKRKNKIMQKSKKYREMDLETEFKSRTKFEKYLNPLFSLLKSNSKYIQVNKKINEFNNNQELIEFKVNNLPEKIGFVTIYSQDCLSSHGSGSYIWEIQFKRIVPKAGIKVGITPKLSEIIKSQRKYEKVGQEILNYREKLDNQIEIGSLPGSYAISGLGYRSDHKNEKLKLCSEFNSNDILTFFYNSDYKYLALAKNGKYLGKIGFDLTNNLYFGFTFYSRSIKINQLILNKERGHLPVTFNFFNNTFGNIYINRFCKPTINLLENYQKILNSKITLYQSQGNFYFKKIVMQIFSRFVAWVHPFVKKIFIGNAFLTKEEQIIIQDYALLAKNRIKLYFIIFYGADSKEKNKQMYTLISEILFFINLYSTCIRAPNYLIASKIIQHNLADRYKNSLIESQDNNDNNRIVNHLIITFDDFYQLLSSNPSSRERPYIRYTMTGESSEITFINTNRNFDQIVFPNENSKI
ncbi:stress response protein nst1-related [Anaeramoeba flamelloides]|uniref:Stress response protein nst1-related n=1 Tax=Anaeramoeba flamelloides TaxID=1746091 RepID=A0ABQ8YHN7_9EUKA|nr:stress response protein nst1-related [Anaeramoeba flamelloides]